ncbi:hypothetical protein NL676_006361 [Syzygium grande]|nr:hypothetical protein NL676_006361 [Syzygium grande]
MPSRLCNRSPLNLRIERSPSTEKHNDRAIIRACAPPCRRSRPREALPPFIRALRLFQPPDLDSTAEADAVSLLANRQGRENGEKRKQTRRESEIATRSPPWRSRAARHAANTGCSSAATGGATSMRSTLVIDD